MEPIVESFVQIEGGTWRAERIPRFPFAPDGTYTYIIRPYPGPPTPSRELVPDVHTTHWTEESWKAWGEKCARERDAFEAWRKRWKILRTDRFADLLELRRLGVVS